MTDLLESKQKKLAKQIGTILRITNAQRHIHTNINTKRAKKGGRTNSTTATMQVARSPAGRISCTASIGDPATRVSDDDSDGLDDTGVEIRTARPSAPKAITAELADTTTQLRTLINEMRRLHPTTCHSSAKLSVPEHPTTVHAPPKMEYMGLDARLCEIRLGHAGAAAIRTQRQVAKPQSDF